MGSDSLRRRLPAVLAIGATLSPAIGIGWFGWDLLPLLVVYWLEAVVYVTRCSLESLFAGRPVDDDYYGLFLPLERLREKRGSVRVVEWLPPVFPRNVPFALNGGWLLFALGTLGALTMLFARPPGTLERGTLVGIGGATVLVVGRHAATLLESIRSDRYKTWTALSPFARRRRLAVGIVAVLVPIVGLGATRTELGLTATVGLLLATKLWYDLLDLRTPDDQPTDPQRDETAIDVPETAPLAVGHTDGRGIALDALVLGAMLALLPPVGFVILFSSVAVGLWVGLPAGVATVVLLVAARAALELPIASLRVGAVEYRVYDAAVIAYDTRLDAPQWRLPRCEITDVRTDTAFMSPLLSGAVGTVRIDCADGSSRSLSLVRNPEAVGRALAVGATA
ncbi:DUF6498-containing protein [Natrinema gari]|uniref:DUF304 domain-containing protein n=1 Tax=Natrinema gari JCM 14663 TaxID=1230459 RepID=L9YMR5_9EURY|nr:DUF6498-containing protein [Natrinema gari]ELY75419.1 hypothetical protein C486_19493 [Natrinema gari JCM 14663]